MVSYEFHDSDEMELTAEQPDTWVVRAVEHYNADLNSPPVAPVSPGLAGLANLLRSAAPPGDGKRTRVLLTDQHGHPKVVTLAGHWELHQFGNLVAPSIIPPVHFDRPVVPELPAVAAVAPWSEPRTDSRPPRRAHKPARKLKHKRRTTAHRAHTAEVREWAKSKGYRVNDYGRLPTRVWTDYEFEHPSS